LIRSERRQCFELQEKSIEIDKLTLIIGLVMGIEVVIDLGMKL